MPGAEKQTIEGKAIRLGFRRAEPARWERRRKRSQRAHNGSYVHACSRFPRRKQRSKRVLSAIINGSRRLALKTNGGGLPFLRRFDFHASSSTPQLYAFIKSMARIVAGVFPLLAVSSCWYSCILRIALA
ncbi:MAG: hypothetical protein HY322_12565 [Betaproteobacteria bacterium]|nr:hypothetical protein [Betaproteobacteria bacterium]